MGIVGTQSDIQRQTQFTGRQHRRTRVGAHHSHQLLGQQQRDSTGGQRQQLAVRHQRLRLQADGLGRVQPALEQFARHDIDTQGAAGPGNRLAGSKVQGLQIFGDLIFQRIGDDLGLTRLAAGRHHHQRLQHVAAGHHEGNPAALGSSQQSLIVAGAGRLAEMTANSHTDPLMGLRRIAA